MLLGLRHLRAPLIMIVLMFATGIAGLVLIPGVTADGVPWRMTFSQALYFMSYTATTIGFGEIPAEFSDIQRLWVTVLIFGSVVAWAYLVGSILTLGRDAAFRSALTAAGFAGSIRALREPFYLICGFGETGLLVGRALDRLGLRFAVVDIDAERVQQVKLLDLVQDAPALCSDARLPETLLQAGLARDECAAVLALTNDDQANLAVAMAVRLLNPSTPVLARAMSSEVAANMASFGTDHIVNPFARFGTYLGLALAAPDTYRLTVWLTGLPGSEFNLHLAPPRGHWVVCGYGRFGREVVAALSGQGVDATVIDPTDRSAPGMRAIRGTGTEAAPLMAAGILDSVGVIAGTDDDITNLSIAVTAREINANLFTVLRQNLEANSPLFMAFGADMTILSSEIVANDCLALIKTPRLGAFLRHVREQTDAWALELFTRAVAAVGATVPEIWSVPVTPLVAPALHRVLQDDGRSATVGDLARDPRDRGQTLPMVALGLWRDGRLLAAPGADVGVRPGDELLFAGTLAARRAQVGALRNLNACSYVLTGNERPSGWIWQKLGAKPNSR